MQFAARAFVSAATLVAQPTQALKLQSRSKGFIYDKCVNVHFLEEPKADFTGDASKMTPEQCHAFCGAHKSSTYFGIRKGGECWCAAGFQQYAGAGPGDCDVPCPGDPKTMCGGQDSTSIWIMAPCGDEETNVPVKPTISEDILEPDEPASSPPAPGPAPAEPKVMARLEPGGRRLEAKPPAIEIDHAAWEAHEHAPPATPTHVGQPKCTTDRPKEPCPLRAGSQWQPEDVPPYIECLQGCCQDYDSNLIIRGVSCADIVAMPFGCDDELVELRHIPAGTKLRDMCPATCGVCKEANMR